MTNKSSTDLTDTVGPFTPIINKNIKFINFNQEEITFNLADGERVSYQAVGDCCSSSYIESLDCPEVFNDSTLISVDVVSGKGVEINENVYYKWTFYKFKTSKGMCTLSFRNESNGYYDGWLVAVAP